MIGFLSQHAGIIGLIFFISAFLIMLFYVFRPGAKKKHDAHKEIPFKGDENDRPE